MNRIVNKRRGMPVMLLALWGSLAAGCSGAPNDDFAENGEGDTVESVAQAATVGQMQTSMDQFYNINNLVTINISMPQAEWNALMGEFPNNDENALCADLPGGFPGGPERYPTHFATQVVISGSNFPAQTTFNGAGNTVEVQKKSNCGSFSTTKPSIKLKFTGANATVAENSIGTPNVTLNNSIQDQSFIRQCFGYKLFNMAGVPAPRCNIAQVLVNGVKVDNGIFVNVEPIRMRFFDNPANNFVNRLNGSSGNLYELGGQDWFGQFAGTQPPTTPTSRISMIDVEKDSRFATNCVPGSTGCATRKDLMVAAAQIASGVTGLQKVVSMSNFVKFFAMESLLGHSDGYAAAGNNAYVFNDAIAVANPSPDASPKQINLKFIPWGIDQILPLDNPGGNSPTIMALFSTSPISRYVLNTPALRTQLMGAMATLRDSSSSPFSRTSLGANGAVQTYLTSMRNILVWLIAGMNQADQQAVLGTIDRMPLQMKYLRSTLISAAGIPGNVSFLDAATGNAMHASSTEEYGAGSGQFEVVHQNFTQTAAQRWTLGTPLFNGHFSIKNEAYPTRWLHCSNTQNTSNGHRMVNNTVNADFIGGEDYSWIYDTGEPNTYSAFKLRNWRTSLLLRFGNDDAAPSGRQRVYQVAGEAAGSRILWW